MGNDVKANYVLIAIYIFSAYLLIRAIKTAFFTKLETFDDYQKRSAHYFTYFRSRNKSIEVMNKALKTLDLNIEERNAALFQIGIQYHFKKDYKRAVEYFDQVWGYIKKSKIPYEKMLACIVVSNYNIGEKEKARVIYHTLRQKERYDPRFDQLSYLESTIFK